MIDKELVEKLSLMDETLKVLKQDYEQRKAQERPAEQKSSVVQDIMSDLAIFGVY